MDQTELSFLQRQLINGTLDARAQEAQQQWLTAGGYNNGFILTDRNGLESRAEGTFQYRPDELNAADRRLGLAEYCIRDMDEKADYSCGMKFGPVNPNNCTADAYTYIGRALASSEGMADNPADFIRAYAQERSILPDADAHGDYAAAHAHEPVAAIRFSLQFPAEWQTKDDLYRAIGEQFSNACRKQTTQRQGREKAAMEARAKEAGIQAAATLSNIVLNGKKKISVEESNSLAVCGYAYESAVKARKAYETWLAITDEELDTMSRSRDKTPQQVSKIREDLKQSRLSRTPNDKWAIAAAADVIGGDEQARALFLDAVRNHALKNANRAKDEGNFSNATAGIGRALETVVENIGDVIMTPVETAMNAVDSAKGEYVLMSREAMQIDAVKDKGKKQYVHWYDALPFVNESMRERRRIALTDDVRKTAAAVRSAVNAERPMWTDAPVAALEGLAKFSMLMNKKTAAIGAVNVYNELKREVYGKIAGSEGEKDANLKKATWWERQSIPITRTGITVGTFALVGGINSAIGKSAGAMWENTAAQGTKLLVNKVLSNRAVAFGASAVKADIALQEIQGIEYLANSALDLIIADRQQKGKELREGIAANWSREGAEERIWSAVLFGAAGFNGMRDVQLFSKWENALGMSKEQKDRLHAARNKEEFTGIRNDIFRELNEADPTAFAHNLEKAGEIILSEAEKEELHKSGITAHILEEQGITARPLPGGKKEYTLPQADGKTKTVVWTEEQANNYVWNDVNRRTLEYALDIQARARGEKLAAAAEKKADDYLTIVSMAHFEPELLDTLKNGVATEKTFRALADLANRRIDEWTRHYEAEGYNSVEARAAATAKRHDGTGVTYGTLANIGRDFSARTDYAAATGEGKKVSGSAAFLMPRSAGELTLALARGEVTEAEMLHDLIESRIRHQIETNSGAAEKMKETMVRIDRNLRDRLGAKNGILPKDRKAEELTETDIVEAMSHLATADFLANRAELPLSRETHAALDTAAEHLADLQTLTTLADLWKKYAATAKGKEALAENANLLQDILKDSKAYIGDIYAEAEKASTADAVRSIIDREEGNAAATRRRVEDYRRSREEPTAEEEAAQPESSNNPYPISAEDSPTGQTIPAEHLTPKPNVDAETGRYEAPPSEMQTDAQGKGRDFTDGEYVTAADGYPVGSCSVGKIAVPKSAQSRRAAMNIRNNDPADSPLIVFRDKDGNLTAISGLGKLMNAKRANSSYVEAKIVDESAAFTAHDAAVMQQEYSIRMQFASVEETLNHIENENLTRSSAAEKGLIPMGADAQEAPANAIAWQLHEQGSPALKTAYKNKAVTEEGALRICELAPADADLQGKILDWKREKPTRTWGQLAKKAAEYKAEREKNAESGTATFSIRELKTRKPLAELMHEDRMRVLIAKSKDLAREGKSILQAKVKDPRVAELLGRVVGLHSLMRKEFENSPAAKESTKTALTNAEMRVRALQDILNGKTDTANVKKLPADAVAEAKKAIVSGNQTRWVCDYLLDTEHALLDHAARTIETEEANYALDKLDSLIAKAQPKTDPETKRSIKGRTGVEASRNVVRWRAMMNLPKFEIENRREAQQAALEKAQKENNTAAEQQALDELAALTTYGAVRSRDLDAIRTAAETLSEYIETESKAWQEKLKERYRAIEANREQIRATVPNIDRAKQKTEEKENEGNLATQMARSFTNFGNFYHFLERISTIPHVGTLARRWKQSVAIARDRLNNVLHSDYGMEKQAIATITGMKRALQQALWLEEATDLKQTEISTEGHLKQQIGVLSVDEAQRIINLTPAERVAERQQAEARAKQNDNGSNYAVYPSEAAVADLKKRLEYKSYIDDKLQYANYGTERDTSDRSVNMKISRMQAANIVLLAEQPSYTEQLAGIGYTHAVIEQLRAFAGTEVMQYGYWCRNYLNGLGTRRVFEERMGIPFPAEENYWPGNFDASTMSDAGHGLMNAAPSRVGMYTFLISRTIHDLHPDNTLGVNQVFRIALQAHRNYEICSKIADEIRNTISDTATQYRMRQIMGDWDFKRFADSIDTIDGAYRADIAACRAERTLASRWNNAKVFTWLAGRITPIMYNLTNVFNWRAAEGVTLRDVLAAMFTARDDKGNHAMTVRKMFHSPAIQARLMRDDSFERLTMAEQGTKFSPLSIVGDKALQGIAWTDAWTNALSMTALYNADFRKIRKMYPEMPESAIRSYCERRVSETLNMAAQPTDATAKSVRYITNTDAIAQLVWFCKSDVLTALSTARTLARRSEGTTYAEQKEKGIMDWQTIRKNARAFNYLLPGSFLTQGVRMLMTMFSGNAPNPEDDPEGYNEWKMRNALYATFLGGWLENTPLLGEFIRYAGEGKIATALSAGGRSSQDPLGAGDVIELVRGLAAIGSAGYDATIGDWLLTPEERAEKAKAQQKREQKEAKQRAKEQRQGIPEKGPDYRHGMNVWRGLSLWANLMSSDSRWKAYVKGGTNVINTGLNFFREPILRAQNENARARKKAKDAKKKKKTSTKKPQK